MAEPVYLDYNATTPLDPSVIEAITKSLTEDWGNPSSSHPLGLAARRTIETSRRNIAAMINAKEQDIVFMSGGTEANNVALLSAISSVKTIYEKPHVITSNVEHDSIGKFLEHVASDGIADVSVAAVDPSTGEMSVDAILREITDRTCLISIMHANNETGILMPISQIGSAIQDLNEARRHKKQPTILFHTDAAQSLGKVKVDVEEMQVDYLTIVGHKFYGPRIGALFVKGVSENSTPLTPLVYGGGQERGLRSGTENTPMICGLGEAAALVAKDLDNFSQHMKDHRDLLASKLLEYIPGSFVNFSTCQNRLPNTLSLQLPPGVSARLALEKCSGKLLASVGAACHSNVDKPSRILLASGLSPNSASQTLRLSVGRTTTVEEINSACELLKQACLSINSNLN